MAHETDYPKILFPDYFDARSEFEMPLRGYLDGVLVEALDGSRYSVFFIDIYRLSQELESSSKRGVPCFWEHGLVVLPEVTVAAIEVAVPFLWRQGFFDRLKPLKP
jgi:hypothetical protein